MHESTTERTPAKTRAFDETAKALATNSSRRTVVRGLAAGLFAMAGGGIATSAMAKKKRKNKPQRPKPTPTPTPKTCPKGTSVAFLAVPADGSVVHTPVLEKGQIYELRASGFWATNGEYFNDAFAAFHAAAPLQPVMFHNGVRLGLSVNGDSPDLWGSYNPNHTYSTSLHGKGERASLRMLDSVYSDNSRLLNVEVLCLGAAEG